MVTFSAEVFTGNSSVDLEKIKGEMNGRDTNYYVMKAPDENNGFIGVNYLKDVSLIIIHSTVPKDNVSFIDEEIAAKNYKDAYLDLSMMKGNAYTIIFDFMIDGIKANPSSGDFIKNNNKVSYLNKGYLEAGFSTPEEYQEFIQDHEAKYNKWLSAVERVLIK